MNFSFIFFMLFITTLGLVIGRFINVVTLRLPKLILMQPDHHARFTLFFLIKNLLFRTSDGEHCHHSLAMINLIPLVSYFSLATRCRYCRTKISLRYLMIEIITLLLSLLVVCRFEENMQLFPALFLAWTLLTLAIIDFEHLLLPNCITLPIALMGLFCNFFGILQDFPSALFGAICGYLSLWMIHYSYKMYSQKDGLGFGDIKLFAMLGAWLGWKMLPFILLLASTAGSLWGVILMLQGRANQNTPLPFGTCLAMAGLLVLLLDSKLLLYWL